jgi:hypothetical protein
MNLKYKIASLIIPCLLSGYVYAQPGRPAVKQPPRINGVIKATTSASVNAKIHANSNSVFGTNKTHPNYNKKKVAKKDEITQDADTKKGKIRKQKNKGEG